MPFKSVKQRAYLAINHPSIAHRWAKHYGSKVTRTKRKKVTRGV